MSLRKVKALILSIFFFSSPLWAASSNPQVILETSEGVIEIELLRDAAPISTANFLDYVEKGFYNGTIFHRVISGFMIQGGGFTSSMKQKATNKPILNEADNGLSNLRGTLAMARTSDPHSATGQFFINHSDNTFLDHKAKSRQGWGYAVFGKVTQGLPVVDIIASAKTSSRGGMGDVPKENIIIISASVKH
jgi:cyclophilin family peptidyl-prolyl cis-trans isomerase